MAPSSSAKKVARLASRGKGKKVRFQGGSFSRSLSSSSSCSVCWLIVYGRQSRPSDGSGVPRVNDGTNIDAHWHAAFGIYICDTFQPKITGTKEETSVDSQGNTVCLNDKFRILGIHSHGDGIIHYHPYSTKSSGNRAKLGVFLDVYDIKLTDTELVMPADQGGDKWSTDDFKCDGKDTQLDRQGLGSLQRHGRRYHDVVTDFNNIRITNDGMVFVVAFVPKGADIPQPDWAAAAADTRRGRRWRGDRDHHDRSPGAAPSTLDGRHDGRHRRGDSTTVATERHRRGLDHHDVPATTTTGG